MNKSSVTGKVYYKDRKNPLNGFKPSISWNVRGKSNAEKLEIIADLKRALEYVRKRKKLAYPTSYKYWKHKAYYDGLKIKQLQEELRDKKHPYKEELKQAKEEVKAVKRQLRSKIHKASVVGQRAQIRAEERGKFASALANARTAIKVRDKKVAKLEAKLAEASKELKTLKHQNKLLSNKSERLQKSLTEARAKNKAPRYVHRIKQAPIPPEVKAVMRYLEKPLEKRVKNFEQVATKAFMWLAKEPVTPAQMSFLMQIREKGSAKLSDLQGVTYKVSKLSEEKGWVRSVYTNGFKLHFLTADGEELVKSYINYLTLHRI